MKCLLQYGSIDLKKKNRILKKFTVVFPLLDCKTVLGNDHILFIYVSVMLISFTIPCTEKPLKRYSLNGILCLVPIFSLYSSLYLIVKLAFLKQCSVCVTSL